MRARLLVLLSSAVLGLGATAPAAAAPAAGPPGQAAERTASTADRLGDRRFVVSGTRAYEVGSEDARYPVMGFHTRGEMGGFWSPPVKLLDGLWFGVDGSWVGPATRFTRGYGSGSWQLPDTAGVSLTRTDVVPDGGRAVLVRLRLTSPTTRTVRLSLDAHSELMGVYPWGETTPSQLTANQPDAARVDGGRLVFTDTGHPWAAVVGAAGLSPVASATGTAFRGPQDPAEVCPASGPDAPPAPNSCDDTAYGRGAGGSLRYDVPLRAGRASDAWFVVAGSDSGVADAEATYAAGAADPGGALAAKTAARRDVADRTRVWLPGDPLLERSIAWTKQDLADSHQQARDLRVRATNAGTTDPPPVGTVPQVDFVGAGFPDYPWLFATDGEYTTFPLVAVGQAQLAADHLRALRDVSDLVNGRSGKIVHETTTDGSVYFGANADPGNTDESVKFPSAVATVWRWTGDAAFRDEMYDASRRALQHVTRQLDADGDGWPEGAGNVERTGQGAEKVDNAAYLIRGWYDLAEMAGSRGDAAAARDARARADALLKRFDAEWWFGSGSGSASGEQGAGPAYADSLADPGNAKVFQRYWTGLTPLEAELPALGAASSRTGVAPAGHALATLLLHETPCYTGAHGLFHTGSGPGTRTPEPGCDGDTAVSSAEDERDTFTLNSAIAAVAEGSYGRVQQALAYSDDVAALQFPQPGDDQAEMPGAMPERAGGDGSDPRYYTSNLTPPFTERGQVLQAWGAYANVWPVVHQLLGVAPDLGVGRLAVLPQLPASQPTASVRDVRLGRGSLDVSAWRRGAVSTTSVCAHGLDGVQAAVGAVLPAGASVRSVTLDGRPVAYDAVSTHRGLQVSVRTDARSAHTVVVRSR